MRQYREAKEQHPDGILLFRLGDFYEIFFEDAEVAAPIMGVTLTSRPLGKTGLIVPELKKYFVAVPPHGAAAAEVLIFAVQ